jgi:hypothetical protein
VAIPNRYQLNFQSLLKLAAMPVQSLTPDTRTLDQIYEAAQKEVSTRVCPSMLIQAKPHAQTVRPTLRGIWRRWSAESLLKHD